jgi:hypothetical protein
MYTPRNATKKRHSVMMNDASRKPDRTYYDAGEAYKGQYKRHVCFGGRDTTAWFEGVDGLTATQDPSEEQAL